MLCSNLIRSLQELDDPDAVRACETFFSAAKLISDENSPLRAMGEGVKTGKPEGRAPGKERCPQKMRCLRTLADHAMECARPGSQRSVTVVDGTRVTRRSDGTFAPGRRGVARSHIAAKVESLRREEAHGAHGWEARDGLTDSL